MTTPEATQPTASQREKLTHETLGPDYKPGPVWKGGREENQDAFFSFPVMPERYFAPDEKENLRALSTAGYELVIVADGMGGHQNGAEASQVLTKEVMSVFVRKFAVFYEQITQKPLATSSPTEIQQFVKDTMAAHLPSLLRHAIVEGNKKVKEVTGYAEASEDRKPGSTIVATFFDRNTNRHVVANVGDSRAQKITQRGKLEQVTEDHSLVARLLKAKDITEEEARRHPERNKIDRSLNGQKIEKPNDYIDVFTVELNPGEVLILNSDGLEVLTTTEIEKVIGEAKKSGTTIDRALVAAVDRKQLLALAEKIEFSGLLSGEEIKKIFEENAHQLKNAELAKLLLEKAEVARKEAIYQELMAINVPGWENKDDLAEKLNKGEVIADAVINEALALIDEHKITKAEVNHLLNGKKFRKIEGYDHDNITVMTIGEVKNNLGNEIFNRAKSIWDSVRNFFRGKDKKTTPATTSAAQSLEQGDAKPERSGPLAKALKWLKNWKEGRAAKKAAAESRAASQSPEADAGLTVEQSVQALLATLKSKDRNLLLQLGLIKNKEEEDENSEFGGLAELGRQRTEDTQNREEIANLEARIVKNRQAERDIVLTVKNDLKNKHGTEYLKHLDADDLSFIKDHDQKIKDIRAIRAALERQLEEARREMGEAVGSAAEELTIDGLAFNPKRRRQVKLALERVALSTEDESKVADIRDALQKHLRVLEAGAWKPFEKLQQKPLFLKIKNVVEKLSGYTKKQWENRPRSFAEWKDRARDKSIERWEKRKDSYDKKEQAWRAKLNLESVTPEELTAWELALRKGQTLEARQVVVLVLEQKIGSIPELNKHKKILKEAGIDLQYDLMDWLKFQWEKKLTDERMEVDASVRKLKEEKASSGNSPEARKELRKAIAAQTEAYLKWLNLKVYDHVKKSAILEAQVDRFGRPNATGIAKEDITTTGWQGFVDNLKRYMSLPKMTAGKRDVAFYVAYLPSTFGLLTAPGLTAGAKNVIMGVTSGVSVGGEVIKQRIEAQYGGDSEAYWESLRAKEGLSSKVLFALQRVAVSRAVQSVRDGVSGGAMAAQVSSLFGFDTFAYQLREGLDRAAQGLSGELPANIQEVVDQNPEIVAEMEELQAELDRVTQEAAQQTESLQAELSDAQQAAEDLEAELEERTRQLAAEQEKLAEAAREAAEQEKLAEELAKPVTPPVEEVAQEVVSETASHLPEALVDYGDQVVQMKGGDFLGDFSTLWAANNNLSAELDPASNANSMAGFLTRAFRALNPGVDPARLDPEKTYNFLTEEAVKALLPEIRAAEKAALEQGIRNLDLPQQLMAAGIDGLTYPTFNDEQLALVLKTALNK